MVNRKNYKEIIEKLEASVIWLNKLGFTCEDVKKTRINKYLSDIKILDEAYKSSNLENVVRKYGQLTLLNSLNEGSEFIDIYEAFKNRSDDIIKRKIFKVVSGPSLLMKEKPNANSNEARNIFFELKLAARFLKSNMDVRLEDNSDISFEINGIKVICECKRPFSDKKIEKNFKEANKQINNKIIRTDKKGIIAISLSKIINEGDKILEAFDEKSLEEKLCQELGEIKEQKKLTQKVINLSVLGILLHISTPAFIKSIKLFTHADQILFISTNFVNHNLIQKIKRKMEALTYRTCPKTD